MGLLVLGRRRQPARLRWPGVRQRGAWGLRPWGLRAWECALGRAPGPTPRATGTLKRGVGSGSGGTSTSLTRA